MIFAFILILLIIITWLLSIEIRQYGIKTLIGEAKASIDDAVAQVKKL